MATRRINLLPPELLHKRRSRQTLAVLGAAGLALVALLAIVYGSQEVRLRVERNRLEAQEETNDQLRVKAAELADFKRLQDELQTKTELATALTADEVRWSVVLADVSLVIPDEVWLTSLNGRLSAAGGGAEEEPDDEGASIVPEGIGSIQLNGTTLGHADVAKWLTRLGSVDAFLFPYLSLSSQSGAIAGIPIVNFNSSIRLGQDALRVNQRGAERRL